MIGFEEMTYLSRVVQAGTIHAAAKSLFITPGALSLRIKTLEEKINTDLFLREGKKLVLTQRGQQLYDLFQPAQNMFGTFQQQATSDKSLAPTLYRWAATHGLHETILQKFWKPWSTLYPNSKCEIRSLRSSEILFYLSQGQLDFGFCYNPHTLPDVDGYLLFEEDLVVAVRKQHPLLKLSKTKRLPELQKFPACLPFHTAGVDSCLDHPWFTKHNLNFSTPILYDNYAVGASWLRQSDFWSLIPKTTLYQHKGLELLYVPEGKAARVRLFVVWPKHRRPNADLLMIIKGMRWKP